MRRVLFLIAILFYFNTAMSQSLSEVKTDLYYGRNALAKQKLVTLLNGANPINEVYYYLGELLLDKGKVDSADLVFNLGINNAEKRGQKKKQYMNLLIGKAHVMLDKGMKVEARQEMDELLKENKYKNIPDLIAVSKATIESKNGDLSWAIELLEKAKKRDSKNAEVYMLLGDAYRKSIEGGLAIANFDKVTELQPNLAEPLYKKGMIYKTQGNPEIYLSLFQKAFELDSNYAPVLYQLYDFYFLRDATLAEGYLTRYINHSDPDPQQDYMMVDVKYNAKKYKEASSLAKDIIDREGSNAQPRLYKLVAYSQLELGDTAKALQQINIYFEKQAPAAFLAKDYELKAQLTENFEGDKSGSIAWYKKALEADSTGKDSIGYMTKLANLEKQLGNRVEESYWRGEICSKKDRPSNLDIYEWGVSLYFSRNYKTSDSVFAIYEDKYPEQLHGYLWRARNNAALDTSMEMGLAVPHYKKFIELASVDTIKNKALLLRAYQYLGAYEANVVKNYAASKEYYNKVLILNPEDPEADKNVKLLEKLMEESKVE